MIKELLHILEHSFLDTYMMIPFLLVIYILIELLEAKWGKNLWQFMSKAKWLSIVIGAILACIPQCGFSVIATALFLKRIITPGTLISVYIATSDEAIPVMLVNPGSQTAIIQVILVKLLIAIVTGFLVDFILSLLKKKEETVIPMEEVGDIEHEKGCCGHEHTSEKVGIKEIVFHPLIHTLKIYLYIFALTFVIGFIVEMVGEDVISGFIQNAGILSSIVIALIGIIPNCAVSVIITQLYIDGIINFGLLIIGLSAGAGLGIPLLFKEKKNIKTGFAMIFILFLVSILWGNIINLFV